MRNGRRIVLAKKEMKQLPKTVANVSERPKLRISSRLYQNNSNKSFLYTYNSKGKGKEAIA